jgi:shikimate kinase
VNLFLTGYRCSGKTTIGGSIARTIGWSFVDSDALVIRKSGKSIQDIIDTKGWDAFRRMERSALKQICANDRQVVATGGGVVLDEANIRAMQASGMVIWLDAGAETIQKRMLQDESTENFRPALTDKGRMAEIEDMLLQRRPYYESASDFTINTDGIPVNEITRIILKKLDEKNIDIFYS